MSTNRHLTTTLNKQIDTIIRNTHETTSKRLKVATKRSKMRHEKNNNKAMQNFVSYENVTTQNRKTKPHKHVTKRDTNCLHMFSVLGSCLKVPVVGIMFIFLFLSSYNTILVFR